MPILALHGLQDLGLTLHRMSVEGRWNEMAAEVPDDVVRIFAACGTYREIAGAITVRGSSQRRTLDPIVSASEP